MITKPYACFLVSKVICKQLHGLSFENQTEPKKHKNPHNIRRIIRPVHFRKVGDSIYAFIPRTWEDINGCYGTPWVTPGIAVDGIPKWTRTRMAIPEGVRFFYCDPVSVAYIEVENGQTPTFHVAFTVRHPKDRQDRVQARNNLILRLAKPFIIEGTENPFLAIEQAWMAQEDPMFKKAQGSWRFIQRVREAMDRWADAHPLKVTRPDGTLYVD